MNRLCHVLFPLILLSINVFAQPGVAWYRTYDYGGGEDYFADIYALANGDYVMCGYASELHNGFLVVRIDENGDEIWAHGYPNERGHECWAYSIIEADNGDLLVVGFSGGRPSIFTAFRLNADGELIWMHEYGPGACHAAVELKEGNFILAGSFNGHSQLIMIDDDGDVIWSEGYGHGGGSGFYTMRETEGGVVAAGFFMTEDNNPQGWVVKVDFEGELIWSREHVHDSYFLLWSMVSCPEGGFLLTGNAINRNIFYPGYYAPLLKINDNGFQEWFRRYSPGVRGDLQFAYGIARTNHRYIIAGFHHDNMRYPRDEPCVINVNADGVEMWRESYNIFGLNLFAGGTTFKSIVVDNNDCPVAAGTVIQVDSSGCYNGVVLKIEPEILEPQFIYYEPEDTVFTVLQGDTVDFLVRAHDAQGDELSYLWTVGDDTVSRDTTATYCFEDLGEYIVTCRVSDGEFTASINWRVTAVEFYIVDFRPDSTEMTIRRRSEVDFAVDVRALDYEGLGYY
ncbi:MAG TPA: PKD domain-containing protein, partial [Bacteroidetes bacterium]|nr:PKD domain-containing protein [Bacteroidota bacterium]